MFSFFSQALMEWSFTPSFGSGLHWNPSLLNSVAETAIYPTPNFAPPTQQAIWFQLSLLSQHSHTGISSCKIWLLSLWEVSGFILFSFLTVILLGFRKKQAISNTSFFAFKGFLCLTRSQRGLNVYKQITRSVTMYYTTFFFSLLASSTKRLISSGSSSICQ